MIAPGHTRARRPECVLDGTRSGDIRGFTLVEMLVVIAVIAILTSLTLPSLRGLVGASGVGGAVSSVMTAMDQARAAALQSGAEVHVGFPPVAAGEDAFSSLIIFRSKAPQETGPDFTPLSRWIRIPTGVVVDSSQITATLPQSPASLLPKLAGQSINPRVVTFDRFGRITTSTPVGAVLRVGEGFSAGGVITFKGATNAVDTLTVQRLTGRWVLAKP